MSDMPTGSLIELNENHRRSISITLQVLDKALCEWEDWTAGHLRSGVMYREENTFLAEQTEKLRCKISSLRQTLERLCKELQLQPCVLSTSQPIVGHASVLWEMLVELDSRSLGAYGHVSEEVAAYIDPIGQKLANEMNEISRLFSRPTSALNGS